MRPSRLALVVLPFLLVTGCGGDKLSVGPPPPVRYAWPESPQALLIAVHDAFEARDDAHYPGLLTSDFRYTFSFASDPNLANQYPNWGNDDEVASARHLFLGFTNSSGQPIPAASSIQLTFTGVQYGPDPVHPDSTEQYAKVILSMVDGTFVIPSTLDSTVLTIKARHELYLVRGDAAVLGPDEEAIPGRWYLRRWDDLSTPQFGLVPMATTAYTWGAIRAVFR